MNERLVSWRVVSWHISVLYEMLVVLLFIGGLTLSEPMMVEFSLM